MNYEITKESSGLPKNFDLGFMDSASQRQNELLTNSGGILNIQDLKSKPFQSNLENAKVLA